MVVYVLFSAGCASSIQPVLPTPTQTTTITPPPTPTPSSTANSLTLVHYSDNGISFDYPSDWPVITQGLFNGADWIPIVLGTGEWDEGCNADGSCGQPLFTLDDDEFVVQLSYQHHGPAAFVYQLPPFDALALDGGLVAAIDDGFRSTRAHFYEPGRDGFVLDVRLGGEPAEALRAAIRAVVESFARRPAAGPPQLEYWDSASIDAVRCERREIRGRLGRGDVLGLSVLEVDGRPVRVNWPVGWTARVGEASRTELLSEEGAVIAREWDEVVLGGRRPFDSQFNACPEAVTVTREFPS
jgi:hypothetical protein